MPIFDAKSLHDAVATTLQDADVPAGHTNAFVVVATKSGVKGVLSTKVGEHWQVDQMISIDTDKHIEAGVQVKATW